MNRVGKQTIVYKNKPTVRTGASIVGPKEGQGPLASCFDQILEDDLLGKETWELAESEMLRLAVELAAEKGGMTPKAVDAMFCGDLLNQIIASAFAGRSIGIPFVGMYGACSTMIETILIAAALIDGEYLNNAICAASSHFCSAERQYRLPLEHGNQRPPSAQWTATAVGATLLDANPEQGMARVVNGTLGRVVDYEIKDANHMGAAMAPAVADTLTACLQDTGTKPDDYDLIVTGDLGVIGRELLLELMNQRGIKIPDEKLMDCGASMYSPNQEVNAGGSGCGCIASILNGLILPKIQNGNLQRIVALGSGAMLSPTSSMQGQSIPCVSYAVTLEGVN